LIVVRPALISCATIGALLLIAAVTTIDAQQPANARRVGVFPVGSASGSDQFQVLVKAFRDGLRDLGWIEGQNVVLEIRWGEGRISDFPKIASEFVALSVDVIVTWGPQGTRAMQQAGQSRS
jgi:putative ABC transport system substrate-binding protein